MRSFYEEWYQLFCAAYRAPDNHTISTRRTRRLREVKNVQTRSTSNVDAAAAAFNGNQEHTDNNKGIMLKYSSKNINLDAVVVNIWYRLIHKRVCIYTVRLNIAFCKL